MVTFFGIKEEFPIIINYVAGILHPSLEESNFIPSRVDNDPMKYYVSKDNLWTISCVDNNDEVYNAKYTITYKSTKEIYICKDGKKNLLETSEYEYSVFLLLNLLAPVKLLG